MQNLKYNKILNHGIQKIIKNNIMKNLFLLPTGKPSRILQCLKVIQLLDKEWLSPIGNINRNIYITSDEEIKEGWFISGGLLFKANQNIHLINSNKDKKNHLNNRPRFN